MARLDDDLDRLLKLAKTRPDEPAILAKLGALHEQRNEFVDALGVYGRAVALNPRNLDAWCRQGFCFMRLFKLKPALETFDFVLQMDARHLDAIYGRAICLETMGAHDEAIALMEHAIAVAPDNPNIYPFRAYLLDRRSSTSATGSLGGQMLESGLGADGAVSAMIREALARTGGNVSETARLTGMTRSQVNYWLKRNRPADVQS
jgi:tetratricopeptide (TPR) repeat protein